MGPKYVTRTVVEDGKRTDTVCQRRVYVIPWYAVVAAGVVTFRGGPECKEETTEL